MIDRCLVGAVVLSLVVACSSEGNNDKQGSGGSGGQPVDGVKTCADAEDSKVCKLGCEAAAFDDASKLLPRRVVLNGGLNIIGILPDPPKGQPMRSDLRKLVVTAAGFGLQVHWVSAKEFEALPADSFSSVIVANSSWELVELSEAGKTKLSGLAAKGVDVLWLGNGMDSALAGVFGVSVVKDGPLPTGGSLASATQRLRTQPSMFRFSRTSGSRNSRWRAPRRMRFSFRARFPR